MNIKGKFGMICGLDGVGKGESIDAIAKLETDRGRIIFDVNIWWGTDLISLPLHDYNPRLDDFKDHNLLITSEPTYAGIGRRIRTEYIRKNGRDYDPRLIAEAYALDRRELYQTTIIPARLSGIDILQSRGVVTSLVYQLLDIQERGGGKDIINEILDLPGNRLAMISAHAPTLLLIPTVENVDSLAERLRARTDKRDDAIFETVEFQRKLKGIYESVWLKELFENVGTKVVYIDAGISVEHTRSEAIRVWKEHLGLNN